MMRLIDQQKLLDAGFRLVRRGQSNSILYCDARKGLGNWITGQMIDDDGKIATGDTFENKLNIFLLDKKIILI